MAIPSFKASAAYKKVNGEISLSQDRKSVIWSPTTPGSSTAAVNIPIKDLTNLQQTPASSAKAVLKLIVQSSSSAAPETYNFTFSSPTTAREELNGLVEPLKKAMTDAQKAATAVPAAASAPSAAMAMAQVLSSGANDATTDPYSDAELLADLQTQRDFVAQNPDVGARLAQAASNKPPSMTTAQVSKQFWTARIHLIRGFKASQQQKKAENNVLGDIQLVRQPNGEMAYNFTGEKIRLIWEQYPFMLKVHNELFKKKVFTQDKDFFGEWLTSRLYKKMKGEKITDQDYEHPHFDRYLDLVDITSRPKHFEIDYVPRFIDIDGNEQNHSQRKGNAPDFTMKPAFSGRNAILNTLNNMSERLMMNVMPTDGESHAPVGVDEETFNELRLRDLQRNDKDNRILLAISDQHRVAPLGDTNGDMQPRTVDSREALEHVQSNLRHEPTLPSEIDDDETTEAFNATARMMKSIRLRASHSSSDQLVQSNVSSKTKDDAVLAHSLTIDFLDYFWGAYLSGDARRADKVKTLYETLQNSQGRFDSVAGQAEQERQSQLEQIHNMEKDMPANKRRRIDKSKLPGGRQAVDDMLAATRQAVKFAESEYRRMLAKQTAR